MIKNINRNLFEKIYFNILCINIFLLNIFVGSTHSDPRTIIETIIIFETFIFIVVSKYIKKEKILIKGKIDITVLAMLITTIIPIIFKTYCSLSYTIDLFVIYLTVYCMYILVRNLVDTPRRKDIFINVILISSCLIIVFGIDRINFKIFQKFYDIILVEQVNDYRMTSTIGYWNAVFAYIVSLMIIALGKYLDDENKKKAGLYGTYIGFAMFAFYYCNSRAGMIIFSFVFIMYLIKAKKISKVLPAFLLVLLSYILTVLFDKLNMIYGNKIFTFVGIVIELLAVYILSYVLKMIPDNLNIKKARKYVIIVITISIFLSFCYIMVAKNYSDPLVLKECGNYINLLDLKNNRKYKIKLELTALSGEQLTIKVLQMDTHRTREYIYTENYNAIDGQVTAEFEIETNQVNLDKVAIEFYSMDNGDFLLNKIYVNNKENIINYKYLPNNLMRLIKTLKFNNISITERLSMYRSGFKLFLQHPIVGNGAKTFYNMYEKVKEYDYRAWEVHSFYMDILMDYGLIGITICISIIAFTIYNFRKSSKKNIADVAIFCSWIFIVIHTMFDFDLAYLLTLANFYVIIALINEDDKKIKANTNLIEYIIITVMLIVISINVYKIPGEQLYRNGKYKEAMKFIPDYVQNTEGYINSSEDNSGENQKIKKEVLIRYLRNEKNSNQYWSVISLYNISLDLFRMGSIDEAVEGIDTIVNLIEKDEILAKYDVGMRDIWQKFERNMKKNIQKLSEENDNYKLKEINNRMQKLE